MHLLTVQLRNAKKSSCAPPALRADAVQLRSRGEERGVALIECAPNGSAPRCGEERSTARSHARLIVGDRRLPGCSCGEIAPGVGFGFGGEEASRPRAMRLSSGSAPCLWREDVPMIGRASCRERV